MHVIYCNSRSPLGNLCYYFLGNKCGIHNHIARIIACPLLLCFCTPLMLSLVSLLVHMRSLLSFKTYLTCLTLRWVGLALISNPRWRYPCLYYVSRWTKTRWVLIIISTTLVKVFAFATLSLEPCYLCIGQIDCA